MALPKITIRQLLEAGVYFGHRTNRWNPKMAPYIYGSKNGIHIINLNKTLELMKQAMEVVASVAKQQGKILFVGTKKQVRTPIQTIAEQTGQFYVNYRWLGGMLTNWNTVTRSINTLDKLEEQIASDDFAKFTKKEQISLTRKTEKLRNIFNGIRNITGMPDLLIVFDTIEDSIAVKEANILGIPIVAIVDTNSDPTLVAYPIPGNDDSMKAIDLYTRLFGTAILDGMQDSLAEMEMEEALENTELEQSTTQEVSKVQPESIQSEKVVSNQNTELPAETKPKKSVKAKVTQKTKEANPKTGDNVDTKKNVEDKTKSKKQPKKEKIIESQSKTTTIAPKMIMTLRERTGAGMMDSKKALVESGGDMEVAVDWLRKKGMEVARKKSGRQAAEGVVVVHNTHNIACIFEINTETDFVARNKSFQTFANQITSIALKTKPTSVEQLETVPFEKGENIKEATVQMVAEIGENIVLRRFKVLEVSKGVVGTYVHNKLEKDMGKIGVVVGLESEADPLLLKVLGENLAIHICATAPLFVSKDSIPKKIIDRERSVIKVQLENEQKDPSIVDKIIEGRMKKFFQDTVLMEQTYFIDGKTKITDVLKTFESEHNTKITITKFYRFNVGEGIEKQEENFKSEVESMVKKG